MEHLVVTGGNGFLGKAICRLASMNAIPVVSISRAGRPHGVYEVGYETVKWVSADVFAPDSWNIYLENCRAVIHCIGILEERPESGITYERMIFAAAKVVGMAAKANGVGKFVFISAGAGAPDTPAAYMENKMAAETFLESCGLDLIVLKPGMLYGPERPETIRENEYIQQLLLDPALGKEIKANRPLHVDTVAKVALYAATHELKPAKLFVDEMEHLATAVEL
jgi:NADH dehydrogenase